MTNQAHQQPTDPADIGPNDLWLVWFSTLPLLQDLGDDPVSTSWVLAARGPKGLEALKETWMSTTPRAGEGCILEALKENHRPLFP